MGTVEAEPAAVRVRSGRRTISAEFARAREIAWRCYYGGEAPPNDSLLSGEAEYQVALRAALGDSEARCQLIEANRRLVFHLVGQFSHSGLPCEDLIQEGNVGLIEAVDRFEPRRGVRFSTYALPWIRGAMARAALRAGSLAQLPERLARAARRVQVAQEELSQELGCPPSEDQVAERLGLSLRQLRDLQAAPRIASLDGGPNDDLTAPEEWLLASSDRPVADQVAAAELGSQVRQALGRLTWRERDVLRLRYGLDHDRPLSLSEAGRRMGITRQSVRSIELHALARLRAQPTLAGLAS